MQPVGIFKCEKNRSYETASQPYLQKDNQSGYIEINADLNPQQILFGLKDMSHIWVIFSFHEKDHWRSMVLPPRGIKNKLGVLATRSPHRPNFLGLSLLKIDKIQQNKIYVSQFDILNNSPIFDVKPFHPEADTPTGILKLGWLENLDANEYSVNWSTLATEQLSFLIKNNLTNLKSFCEQQLSFEPTNSKKKRIQKISKSYFELAYKTWRIIFRVSNSAKKVTCIKIHTGYSDLDLLKNENPYGDKELHRLFLNKYQEKPKTKVNRSKLPKVNK